MTSLDMYNAQLKMKKITRDLNHNFNVESGKDDKYNHYRSEEASIIRQKFPTKIPVIVERYAKEIELPDLDKRKYLVPDEITMSQFVSIIRNRLKIGPSRALFLFVNNRSMISLSTTICEVYEEYKAADGFLYVTYASQEAFG